MGRRGRMDGHGRPRFNNGPALPGHGAKAVRNAIASPIAQLPAQLRRSLTGEQGSELAEHGKLRIDTALAIYCCDPQSPWQRATNDNTNGLLRQYFPKGTDWYTHSREDLEAVSSALNSRPRNSLGWKTPAEACKAPRSGTSHGWATTLARFTGEYDLFGNQVVSKGQILFDTVRRFKGQQEAAVILVDVDPREKHLQPELQVLFCGMTRATARLEVVCNAANPWVVERRLPTVS